METKASSMSFNREKSYYLISRPKVLCIHITERKKERTDKVNEATR